MSTLEGVRGPHACLLPTPRTSPAFLNGTSRGALRKTGRAASTYAVLGFLSHKHHPGEARWPHFSEEAGVGPRCSGMGPVSPAPAGVSAPSSLGHPGLGVVSSEGTHVSLLLWGLVLQRALCNGAPTPTRGPLSQDPVLSPWPCTQGAIGTGTHPDPVQSQQRTP